MKIEKANSDTFLFVKKITQETINQIYPNYYPAGAVEFFKAHHSDDAIRKDIEIGNVYLLFEQEKPIATVTINDNHINRLFVLEEYQHKGFGNILLDFAEKYIAVKHSEVIIDASFPAKHIYLKRGYVDKEYHAIQTDNGNYLCYDVMIKKLSNCEN